MGYTILFSLACILCVTLAFLLQPRRSSAAVDVADANLGEEDELEKGSVGGSNNYKSQFCNLLKADQWLEQQGLNVHGDDPETMYAGGTPLFDETTGKSTYRYDYLRDKFPDLPWMDLTCDKEYPDCMTSFPSYIGDGSCEQDLNTKECGFDGGDCL